MGIQDLATTRAKAVKKLTFPTTMTKSGFY